MSRLLYYAVQYSHHLPLQSELIATCTVLALEAMLNYDVYYV